jgi:hypothetical protein
MRPGSNAEYLLTVLLMLLLSAISILVMAGLTFVIGML